MNKHEGLKEIMNAVWVKDQYNYLNMYVHTAEDHKVHVHLSLRQPYCDRGHIQLLIDGPLNIDGADSFPRYFFSFDEADRHARTFLMWRLWKHRVHPHTLEVPTDDNEYTDEEKSELFWKGMTS